MKKTVFFVALLLYSCSAASNQISRDRFYLSGISIGSTIAQIQSILGNPDQCKYSYSESNQSKDATLTYPGLVIYCLEDRAVNITATSSKYRTKDNINIGKEIKDIIQAYGKNEIQNNKMQYQIQNTDCSFVFHIKNNRISKIELWYDYI